MYSNAFGRCEIKIIEMLPFAAIVSSAIRAKE